jgi:hypothetical protein
MMCLLLLANWISGENVSELGIEKLFWIPLQLGSIGLGFAARERPVFSMGLRWPVFVLRFSLCKVRLFNRSKPCHES